VRRIHFENISNIDKTLSALLQKGLFYNKSNEGCRFFNEAYCYPKPNSEPNPNPAVPVQDLRYFVPLPAGAEAKGKESSVPGKLELLKVR